MFADNPSSTIVVALSFLRDPRTGLRVPKAKEKRFRAWFKRKYQRYPKRERWLYVLDREPRTKPGGVKVGTTRHRIQQKVKMSEVEKIIPATGFTDRHIRDTLTKHKVFAEIWSNWGGSIRISVTGFDGERRIREVIHLGYHREHWEKQEGGRELFRRWLTAAISSNLRRRGLRLSNAQEGQKRIENLRRELKGLQGLTEFVKPERMGVHVNQIKWKADAIRQQKKTRQLKRATIRIEKLI